MSATRTPEGEPNHCFACKRDVVIDPSTVPTADAPCPNCGCLLWFPEPGFGVAMYKSLDLTEFANRIDDWAERPVKQRLVIDFKDVDLIGSTVLGKLISLQRKALARGLVLSLRNLSPVVREVFSITKLDTLFTIEVS